MRAVIQRVREASVAVGGETIARIGPGLLVLLGVGREDDADRANALARKLPALRIFDDDQGRMNLSLLDVGGEMLVVSQFTLSGELGSGRRPSWSRAAPGEQAEPIYREFVDAVRATGVRVAEGRFGANMDVQLVNQGPVTLFLED